MKKNILDIFSETNHKISQLRLIRNGETSSTYFGYFNNKKSIFKILKKNMDKNLENKLRAKEEVELARVSQQSDGGGIFQTIMQGLGGMLGLRRTSRSVPSSRYSTKKSSNQKEITPRKSSESKKRRVAAPAMSIL